jgi:hypothetical protein
MRRECARDAAKGIGRSGLRSVALGAALAAVVALGSAGSAMAAGKAVKVGTPFDAGQPSVAVDPAGDAVIAWANTRDLAPVTTNIVQYCVLPINATACSDSANLVPADSASNIDNVQVLSDGTTLVILADVYGAAGGQSEDYTPEQEWQSTDGGATWASVNGGLSVASGTLSGDTGPDTAVIVPSTSGAPTLGYGWESAASFVNNVGAAPTFDAFPLNSPPECSDETCPASESYSVLESDTNPDQVSNGGGAYAAEAGANPGVIGIFDTDFSNGPLGCSKGEGTSFAYGSGDQSATNSYDISPGSAGTAWKVAVSQGDCDVDDAAVGGGASGFGVLESNDANDTAQYHRFDAAHADFDSKPVTVASQIEQQGALSQDSSGGVYATYLLDGGGGPATLSYSFNGGTTWSSATINANKDGGIGDLNSSVNAAGKGWLTWLDNGSVYAQSFTSSDAITPAVVSSSGTASSSGLTFSVSCATGCSTSVRITATGTAASAASVPARKKAQPKLLTFELGSGKFVEKTKGTKRLTISLSGVGKRFFADHHGKVNVTAAFIEKIDGKTLRFTKLLKIRIVAPPKHRT